MKIWQLLTGIILATLLVGCKTVEVRQLQDGIETLGVTGTVTYSERSALPGDALVTVVLADAPRHDAPMRILSQVSFPAAGQQVPFNFALPYTRSQIMDNSRVIVTARIDLDGQLIYTSNDLYEVVTNGRNTVKVNLDRVNR